MWFWRYYGTALAFTVGALAVYLAATWRAFCGRHYSGACLRLDAFPFLIVVGGVAFWLAARADRRDEEHEREREARRQAEDDAWFGRFDDRR